MTNKNQKNLSSEGVAFVQACDGIINNLDEITAMQVAHYNQDHVRNAFAKKYPRDAVNGHPLLVVQLLRAGYSILAIKSITGWTDASILNRAREFVKENDSHKDGGVHNEHWKLVVEFAIAMYGSYDAVDYERTVIGTDCENCQ